jgi:UDP-N-acetylglucosamine diphosphorylase / glucose-1-phosphate thymidylyltransferase / UDP-N-acetylgalactosamine diphosphorylase / glucosamine-1-phosphate N-acetyltransferase / galactosamine-1-phosphate N-acetyltransferase
VTALYLYDDAAARDFEPYCLSRPASELRAGTAIIRARWERRLQMTAAGFLGAEHLRDFEESGAPPAVGASGVLPAGSVVASSRCVVALDGKHADRGARAWTCGGRVAAVRLSHSLPASRFVAGELSLDELATEAGEVAGRERAAARDGVPMTPASGAGVSEIEGRWLEAPWDLIATLPEQLGEDIPLAAEQLTIHNPADVHVLGEHPVYCERGALMEPWVVLDATAGPILVRRGAVISAFSRLVGPCYVGEDSTIIGDRVSACSIGDVCKVRGEISNSIVLGHSNKGHTGFVGHSYLGRWVNLGAGTTTSNLKNTYGQVQLATRHGTRDTGQQFLGTFFGDHVKTGIGTMLTTGTILGTGANVFGTAMPPKRVPPFAWGESEPYARFDREKFIGVAERVMQRRQVELTERAQAHLRALYDLAAGERAEG